MKILIASDTYHPNVNGAAYFTYRLANELVQKGHQVYVICPSPSFKNTVTNHDGVIEYGVRSIPLPLDIDFRVSLTFLAKSGIHRAIQEIKPDVIHIQNHFLIGKEVARVAKANHIPIIGTNHFMPENLLHYLHLPPWAERPLWRFAWKQCINVFKNLNAVSTPTRTAANLLRNAGFPNEVTQISCGINLERFTTQNDGTYLKKRYNIPSDKPVLLYVGRLDKEKRLEVIIRALPLILKKMDAHLVFAGIGKEKPVLEALVHELHLQHAVTFAGFVPDADLQNIYRVANLFVMCGIAELQSIATMEAMASGLPVVAVNAMALPELVHNGENGYLFPEGDSRALAVNAVTILTNNDTWYSMSEKSLEIIRTHGIDRTIAQYEALYKQAIAA